MTSKSFNTEEMQNITLSMEKSVTTAFNEFAKKPPVPKQFNGTLRRFPSNSACVHIWRSIENMPKEHGDYLKLVTEEEPVPGATKWCSGCGAVSYWENGKLWLFDSTTRFFGKPPKKKRHEQHEF